MKKIGLLLMGFIILLFPSFVNALEDGEPPTLSNIYLDSYTLTPGENVTFYVEGNDNLTGIGTIDIEMRLKNDERNYIAFSSEVTPANKFSYTMKVPEKATPGDYEIYVVQVWDGAGNLRTYYPHTEGWPFTKTDVVVKDSGKDYTAPTLSNFVVPKEATYPGFTFSVDATDDKSGINQVTVYYEINGQINSYNLTKISGNTYSTKIMVKDSKVYSDAKFITVYVVDKAGNLSQYDMDVSRDPYRNFKEIILTENLDVKFTDKIIDTEYPKLNGCEYSSTKVYAPGVVNLICNITDDTGVGDVKIHLKGYTDDKMTDYLIFYSDYNEATKKATSKHTFSQYKPNAIYYIDKVEITDMSGKKVTYTIYDDEYQNMEKKTFTLMQAIVSDETVSTVNDSYIDTIKNVEEGKSITVDTTSNSIMESEVFDSIKGKDVNAIVVNDGIQWVFNGKNIINESKNINTKIDVYKINQYGTRDYTKLFDPETNAVVIEFANNGLLPGKALIRIKADYSLRDYIGDTDLYVYHIEQDEETLEAIAKKIDLSEDGYYEFYITHNSKYIISRKAAPKKSVVKDNVVTLGNDELPNSNFDSSETEEIKQNIGNYNTKINNNVAKVIMCVLVITIIVCSILIIFKKKDVLKKEKQVVKKDKTKKSKMK